MRSTSLSDLTNPHPPEASDDSMAASQRQRWGLVGCSRRTVLGWGAAFATTVALKPGWAQTPAPVVPLADVHSHMGLLGPTRSVDFQPDRFMAEGHVKLVAWKVVPDLDWIRRDANGALLPPPSPPDPDRMWSIAESTIRRMAEAATQAGVAIVTKPADLDAVRNGQTAVVLASEGCDFVDPDLERIEQAYRLGVRHLQMVHYTPNPLGDVQSRPVEHGGLTDLGRRLIERCNRLGILVDLAHLTPPAALAAAEHSRTPVIWSHSAVRMGRNMTLRSDRLLPLDVARSIAARGGVVGLWGFDQTAGYRLSGYVRLVMDTVEALGEDHVAFGTDMSGLRNWTVIRHYGDLAKAVEELVSAGMPERVLRKVAFDNYVRVLRSALTA
ncbi:MAG: membrane dipeptidase [Pseudomonadota bacterium]